MNQIISVRGSAKPWFSDYAWRNVRNQVSDYVDQKFPKDSFIDYPDEDTRRSEAINNETRYYLESNLVDRMNENSNKIEVKIKERIASIFPQNDISVSVNFTHGSLAFDVILNILGDLGYLYAAERTAQISYSMIDKIISQSILDEIKREVSYKSKGAVLRDASISQILGIGENNALSANANYTHSKVSLEKIYKALLVIIVLVSLSVFLFLINLYVAYH